MVAPSGGAPVPDAPGLELEPPGHPSLAELVLVLVLIQIKAQR